MPVELGDAEHTFEFVSDVEEALAGLFDLFGRISSVMALTDLHLQLSDIEPLFIGIDPVDLGDRSQ